MYRVQVLKPAVGELEGLDRSVAARVVLRIRWLAKNFDALKPKRLGGDLAGLYKLREGD